MTSKRLSKASYNFNMAGAYPKARQTFEETPWESEIRKIGKYHEIESQMPLLHRRQAKLLLRLSSLLGKHNPMSKPANSKEHNVWLFNNTAYRVPGSRDLWEVEVVIAYFIKDSGDDSSDTVAKIIEILGITKDERTRARVAQRLEPFLDSVLPAHTSTLQLENTSFKLDPSNSDGISSQIIRFKSSQLGGTHITPSLSNIGSEVTPTTYFAEETGWAVISDVDDTIKRTMTPEALGVLQSTFIDDPLPIEGMPELYSHLNKKFGKPPFWYLSASPYNLYTFLRTFIIDTVQYPAGTLILRDASWMSLAGLLTSVTQGTQAFKTDRMRKIHSWFPKRTFICFGDSTQTDPESYGQMYRENPEWVAAIYIRKVEGVAGTDSSVKNNSERFEKAFEGIPKDVWMVFEDPNEVYEHIDALAKKGLKK